MTACSKGYPQVVEVLLDGGARPDLQSKVRRQYILFQCILVSVIINLQVLSSRSGHSSR